MVISGVSPPAGLRIEATRLEEMGDGAHERRWGQAEVEVRKDGRWGKEVMQVGHGWRAETVEKNGEVTIFSQSFSYPIMAILYVLTLRL
jgi:hypothetical protein